MLVQDVEQKITIDMASEVELRPLSSITPYERNNKTHDEAAVSRLANSIREFGFTQPLLVDEKLILLAGHKRLLAAQEVGLDQVPVIIRTGLTEAQKKAYRIIDNKSTQESPWHQVNIEAELRALSELEFNIQPFIVPDFQFEEPEEPEEVQDDLFVQSDDEASRCDVKLGDLIELGVHRLLCGDSTSKDVIQKLLAGEVPALMVTDPPYGVEYKPEWRAATGLSCGNLAVGRVTNDDRVDWREVFQLWPAAVVYCWHAGKFTSAVQAQLESAGFSIVAQIIWAKSHFVISRGDYHWQHEPCWYAARGRHNWQGARDQSTIWQIANNGACSGEGREEAWGHGTQKPIECMSRPIRNNTGKGELICDPFLGSGTTLIAAEQLGRRCFGTEIEPKYCQMIIDRYRHHCREEGKEFVCRINGESYNG